MLDKLFIYIWWFTNLTTTQPNLNLRLVLTWLLLFTPSPNHPTPRSSISTRKNDPSGLNFVTKKPRSQKIVLHIFVFHPKIIFLTRIYWQAFFWPNKFSDPKVISPRNCLAKYFPTRIFFWPTFLDYILNNQNSLTTYFFSKLRNMFLFVRSK